MKITRAEKFFSLVTLVSLGLFVRCSDVTCLIRAYEVCYTPSCTAKHPFFKGKSLVMHLVEGPDLAFTIE